MPAAKKTKAFYPAAGISATTVSSSSIRANPP
jgi:hypothetical protein